MQHKKQETIDLILEAIDTLNDNYGRSPTQAELIRETGLNSGTISRYIPYMAEEGLIEYEPRHILRVIHEDDFDEDIDYEMIPELGSVACGTPSAAEGNVIGWKPVPVGFLGSGEHYFLRAKGFSMIDAGIDDGDLLIIRKQDHADYHQIVVGLDENGGTTLKRLMYDEEEGRAYLLAENDEYEDLYDDFVIQGILIKCIKDFE